MRGICCVFVCVRERESVDMRESVLEVALRKLDLLVEKSHNLFLTGSTNLDRKSIFFVFEAIQSLTIPKKATKFFNSKTWLSKLTLE